MTLSPVVAHMPSQQLTTSPPQGEPLKMDESAASNLAALRVAVSVACQLMRAVLVSDRCVSASSDPVSLEPCSVDHLMDGAESTLLGVVRDVVQHIMKLQSWVNDHTLREHHVLQQLGVFTSLAESTVCECQEHMFRVWNASVREAEDRVVEQIPQAFSRAISCDPFPTRLRAEEEEASPIDRMMRTLFRVHHDALAERAREMSPPATVRADAAAPETRTAIQEAEGAQWNDSLAPSEVPEIDWRSNAMNLEMMLRDECSESHALRDALHELQQLFTKDQAALRHEIEALRQRCTVLYRRCTVEEQRNRVLHERCAMKEKFIATALKSTTSISSPSRATSRSPTSFVAQSPPVMQNLSTTQKDQRNSKWFSKLDLVEEGTSPGGLSPSPMPLRAVDTFLKRVA